MIDKILETENFLGKSKKNYFEGWYFKHTSDSINFSFIVGISTYENDKHAFVQYIDQKRSKNFKFDIRDFIFSKKNMEIKIAHNTFSMKGIHFSSKGIAVDVNYENVDCFTKTLITPSAMGIFGYLPNKCNHAIISFNHAVSGNLTCFGESYSIDGLGYIEKDYGTMFPQNYFWCQGQNERISVIFAVAYPLIFNIKGFLCFIKTKNKQNNFSLYTGAKLELIKISENKVRIAIKKGKEKIVMLIDYNSQNSQKLLAPNKDGQMNIEVKENLDAKMLILIRDKKCIQKHVLKCALENKST